MILRWPIWPKPVIMTVKDIKMKVLAENLTVKTKYADEQVVLFELPSQTKIGVLDARLITALVADHFMKSRSSATNCWRRWKKHCQWFRVDHSTTTTSV